MDIIELCIVYTYKIAMYFSYICILCLIIQQKLIVGELGPVIL